MTHEIPLRIQQVHNVSPRRKGKKEAGRMFEDINAESFPNLMKNMNLHIKGSQETPSKINTKNFTTRQINSQTVEAKDKE